MRKWGLKFLSLVIAFAMLLPIALLTACGDKTPAGKTEITYKGAAEREASEAGDPRDVYWIDASVQKLDTYTKIVGFQLTVTMTESEYYGGGKENNTFPCGMILVSKGAHEPGEYVFTFPGGQFPEYDLSTKDIVAFGMGDAGFLAPMAFSNGKVVDGTTSMTAGDSATLTYQGETALFPAGEPVMTAVSFNGKFTYDSVEWILGEPEEIEEQPWDKVETTVYKDVATVSQEKQNGKNYVDITVPKTGKDSYPVFLWIHGGGYITGDRANCILSTTKDYMLAQGYAFVSVGYTLTGQAEDDSYTDGCMPQALHDVKAAVRFLRANAATYKLDTDFIVTAGESAGAGLSLLMGATNTDCRPAVPSAITQKYGDIYEDLSMGNETYSSDVQAVISVCGPTCFTGEGYIQNMYAYLGKYFADNYTANGDAAIKAEIEQLAKLWSPTELVCAATPPMYLTYSKQDTTVPVSHADDMKAAALEFMDEEDVKTVIYSEGGHVDRSKFDSYTAYVTLAGWVNAQRDKVLG